MHLRRSREYIGAYTSARILLPTQGRQSVSHPQTAKVYLQAVSMWHRRYVCITIQDTGTDVRHRPVDLFRQSICNCRSISFWQSLPADLQAKAVTAHREINRCEFRVLPKLQGLGSEACCSPRLSMVEVQKTLVLHGRQSCS